MTPQRAAELLRGQTAIAQKVFAATPAGANEFANAFEIAKNLRDQSGSTVEIHTLRGCLAKLEEAGLIRQVVRGSWRRVEAKEKTEMPKVTPKLAEPAKKAEVEPKFSGDPIEVLGGIAQRLRGHIASLGRIADEIDSAALMIEEKASANSAEYEKYRQLATLLKEIG